MKSIKLNRVAEYMLRIEKGEEIYSSILRFCKEKEIKFAEFSGIGAMWNFEYGIFENGEYVRFFEKDLCELTSINGNISFLDGDLVVHSHATWSKLDENNNLVPILAHVFHGEVAVTVEIKLTAYDNHVERKFEEACGLKVLDLDKSL